VAGAVLEWEPHQLTPPQVAEYLTWIVDSLPILRKQDEASPPFVPTKVSELGSIAMTMTTTHCSQLWNSLAGYCCGCHCSVRHCHEIAERSQ
jgi:hypothetical protein